MSIRTAVLCFGLALAGCMGASQTVGPGGVEQRAGPFRQSVGPGGVQQSAGPYGPSQSVGPGGVQQSTGGRGAPACQIDCGGQRYAVSCPSGANPVCQCQREPYAVCTVPPRSSSGY
ncbi:MAG: hypothetical protein ACLGI7_15075 [Gammaproteobacteria bacterium]